MLEVPVPSAGRVHGSRPCARRAHLGVKNHRVKGPPFAHSCFVRVRTEVASLEAPVEILPIPLPPAFGQAIPCGITCCTGEPPETVAPGSPGIPASELAIAWMNARRELLLAGDPREEFRELCSFRIIECGTE
jgi:hypothetical protein